MINASPAALRWVPAIRQAPTIAQGNDARSVKREGITSFCKFARTRYSLARSLARGLFEERKAVNEIPFSEQVAELGERFRAQFSHLLDYIWKAPRLIDHERRLEFSKLDAYFPIMGNDSKEDILNMDLQIRRWESESNKLENSFPRFMASSNLFIAASLFEISNASLAQIIESRSTDRICNHKNQGLARIRNFYENHGINYKELRLHRQVEAALKIRNCLYHANGLLILSREQTALRDIIRNNIYLENDTRERIKKMSAPIDYIEITSSNIGEQILLKNEYAHIATAYFRDNFVELCSLAKKTTVA